MFANQCNSGIVSGRQLTGDPQAEPPRRFLHASFPASTNFISFAAIRVIRGLSMMGSDYKSCAVVRPVVTSNSAMAGTSIAAVAKPYTPTVTKNAAPNLPVSTAVML